MPATRAWWFGSPAAVVFLAAFVHATVAQEHGAPLAGMEQAWSVEGRWSGVVGDEKTGAIYACGLDGKSSASMCAEFGLTGRKSREFPLPRAPRQPTVRIAHLFRGARAALVAFHLWSEDLRAYDASGKTLWSYQGGGGVDDVWVSDLNGDGADEVIVGYNGASGERPLGLHGSGETMAGTGPGPVGLRLFWRL